MVEGIQFESLEVALDGCFFLACVFVGHPQLIVDLGAVRVELCVHEAASNTRVEITFTVVFIGKVLN